jgi:ubiquitin carboxyl-terminal hydrolase 1
VKHACQVLTARQASCRLEDCLTDYTRLELLNDCICRKCSMLATHKRLVSEAEKATEAVSGEHEASSSKKKRAREARKLEARVKAALDEGRIEEDIKGVKMEKVFSRCSTKQAMIARVRFAGIFMTCLTPSASATSRSCLTP